MSTIPRPTPFRAHDLTPEDVAPLAERFQRYCHRRGPNQCWLWAGARDQRGYGVISRRGRGGVFAHRVAWVLHSQQALVNNLTIDHLCRNKRCVNPNHLETVTVDENYRRSLVHRFGPEVMKRHRVAVHYGIPTGQPRRRICPVCGADYDRSYVAAHVRRVHPEAV